MTEKITYNSLLRDDKFLNDAYHSLRAQGINVSKKRKDIVDRFLTNKRYFDTNLASTFVIGDEVKKMSDANKQSYSRAVTKVEQLPSVGKIGAAPTSDLIKDYLVAGVTDPTNLISILAGAFTFGTGGAAIQVGKETAKAGLKKTLQKKIKVITKQQQRKALAKTLAAEGTIAGVGGVGQNLKAQEVDMAIGRRAPGQFDIGSAVTQGVIEGIASPVAGVALAGIGKAGVTGFKKIGSLATKTKAGEEAAQYMNFIKNYLLPFGGVDDITQRNFERGRAIFKEIKVDTENVVDNIKIQEQKYLNKGGSLDDVNSAMEGNKEALETLSKNDSEMFKAVNDFVELRKRVYKTVFKYTDPQSQKIEGIYKIKPQEYTKRVNNLSQNKRLVPFKFWKTYEANEDLMKQLKAEVKTNKELQVQFGIREGTLDKATKKVEKVGDLKKTFEPKSEGKLDIPRQEKLIDNFVERKVYESFYPKGKPTKFGGLKRRKDINPILQKIWGVNTSPAVRAAETIGAITEPISEVLVADQIGKSLLGRGIGIRVTGDKDVALAKAIEARPNDDMVPLVGDADSKTAAIRLPRTDIFNPELGQIFVPRQIAEKLRVLTDTKPVFGNSMLGSLFSGANGYLKKGVTVYNPYGHVRNAMGVPQYVAASGNLKGITNFANKLLNDKEGFSNFQKIADRLGVTATNVEINQILGRLSDARKIEDEKGLAGFLGRRFLDLSSGGISAVERTGIGKKVSRKAERTYTGTDDVGKVMTLLSELTNAQKIFSELTPAQKELKRAEFSENFGIELPKIKEPTAKQIDTMLKQSTRGKSTLKDKFEADYQKKLVKFDEEMLLEDAAGNTLNVIPTYDRVPKILEKMRDIPILGAFTAFPAENLRNKYNILKLGAQQLREGFETGNKALQKAGAQRLRQQIAMAAIPTVAAYTYNQVMGTDKVESAIRKTQPELAKYHALQIRFKGKDKQGNDTYGVTDLSYNNPDQYVLDIITPLMMAAASGEDVTEKLDELFPYAVKKTYEPYLSPSMATELGLSFLNYAKADTDEGRIRHLTNTYKLIEPGFVKLLRDVGGDAAVEGAFNVLSQKLYGRGEIGTKVRDALNPSYFGDTAKLSKSLTELGFEPAGGALGLALYPFRFGIKEQDYKPKKQIGFAVSNLMRNANGTLKGTTRSIKNNLSNPNVTKTLKLSGIIKDYQEAIEEQFVAQQGVHELINDLKSFMTVPEIRAILRDRKIKAAGGFSNKEIENIIDGRFTIPRFNKKELREAANNNPDIRKYVNNIQNNLNRLEDKYLDKPLQTESLPDINIGD